MNVSADKVLINGKFYCGGKEQKFTDAVAIKDGKLELLGTFEAKKLIGAATEVVNLEGKMVLPGFMDPHIHALHGGYKKLFECNLPEGDEVKLDDILEAISIYVKQNPDNEWVVGGNWAFGIHSQLSKELLDNIDSTRPMVFFDFSTHNAWVNSKALERAGIDNKTQEPEGGHLPKNENGELTGLLVENACNLIEPFLPYRKREELYKAGVWVSDYLNSKGITGIKDPAVDEELLEVYAALTDDKKWNVRTGTHLMWKCDYGNNIPYEEQKNLVYRRWDYERDNLDTNYAKMFLDGVPAYKTAAFLEPYPGEEAENHDPLEMLLVDPEVLKQDLIALDQAGVTVKMHATGDAAVRAGLDAIEEARTANGNSGLVHEIAHNGFVDESDIPRFRQLRACAEFSPTFWYPTAFQEQKATLLGQERVAGTFPVRSVYQTGALVVRGSDWPVASPDPWMALETLVTRKNPFMDHDEILNAAERLTLEEALELFTINAAKTLNVEHRTGSIEIGKAADLIVIDRDLFHIPPEDIHNVRVCQTLLDGEVVYDINEKKE
ncbi:amidohydrolase [Salibacterium sp. K-3]